MKRMLLYLLVVFSLTVYAQQQSDNGETVEPRTAQPAEPCKDIDDDSQDTSGGARSGDETEIPAEQRSDPCKDNEIERQDPLDMTAADVKEETNEAPEESNPNDADFKPSEEISEDYPVPLPSDI